MLTLTPGCACEVCAEEYGPNRLPHSITCGHVLCATCCQTIIEKTSSRLSPVCPFCRVAFSGDSMRLIRTDFATSGWNTPRRVPAVETLTDINSDILQRKTAHLFSSSDASRTSYQVRRLENKVSNIAAKKCSVEEVSTLYKELEGWLLQEKDDQTSSLFLSAALLRAILMNHVAHSDASKAAKTNEANMRNKIEDLELNSTRLDAELRKQRTHLQQKTTECNSLRVEVSQLRALASTIGSELPATTPTSYSSSATSPSAYTSSHSHSYSHSSSATSPQTSHSTSPTPFSSASHYAGSSSASAAAAASVATPISRFNSTHGRSVSMSARPMTPASISMSHSQQPTSPTRSHTPAPPRSHTPGPSPARSHTPAPRSHTPAAGVSSASAAAAQAARSHTPSLMRSHTPASAHPPMPVFPTRYSSTPTPSPYTSASAQTQHPPHQHTGPPMSASTGMGGYGLGLGLRAQTPAPAALVPPKPRRLSLSTPSPPKMMNRSTSDEKAEHQRWLPPSLNYGGRGVVDEDGYGMKHGSGGVRSGSRAGFRV